MLIAPLARRQKTVTPISFKEQGSWTSKYSTKVDAHLNPLFVNATDQNQTKASQKYFTGESDRN